MGRDDNKRVAGLAGGAAPARAFAAFMKVATKGMPVEQLDSDIQIDDEFAEPDAEVYGIGNGQSPFPDDYYSGAPSYDGRGFVSDPFADQQQPEGEPGVSYGVERQAPAEPEPDSGDRLSKAWLDEAVPGQPRNLIPPADPM